jgi:hypothetical protein
MSALDESTIRETGCLDLGVLVGGAIHRAFVLRPATLADAYRAAETVPVPLDLESDRAAQVAYQMAVDDAQVLCQVVELGTLSPLPPPAQLVALIDPDDMAILRQAASAVKKKWRQSRLDLRSTDAPSSS